MPDPLLLAHGVYPFTFDIGGRLMPISIRDQMVRSRMIVDHAVDAGLIGPGRRLVVAGAGAAGVTAAIHAADTHSVHVLLVEKCKIPFAVQAGCATRWVDPVQYDWPCSHWSEARYPWDPPNMPLFTRANFADVLAAGWTSQFLAAQRRLTTLLHFAPQTTITGVRPASLGVDIDFSHTSGTSTVSADMLLTCFGFGTEVTTIGGYAGYPFWQTDPYGTSLPRNAKVLISGGGDGALQDFLRIVTGLKCAQEILDYLKPKIPASLAAVWNQIENQLQTAEDQMQRAHTWSFAVAEDHQLLKTVYDSYNASIQKLIGDPRIWATLSTDLQNLTQNTPDVTLVHRCDHFGRGYALNRFLTLLLLRYFQIQNGSNAPVRAIPNTEVVAVTPVGHVCSSPAFCHTLDHEVATQAADCWGHSPLPTRLGTFNVIIVRHGITPAMVPLHLRPVLLPRQMLPYHVTI